MDLAITSMGMVTCVGHDVATACASIRAGLSRPRPITHPDFPLNGYPLTGYADGFRMLGFWIRVSLGCLEDLLAYGNLPAAAQPAFWARTGLIGVTPPMNDARFGGNARVGPDQVKEAFLYRLLEAFPYPLSKANLDVICTSHAGAILAIDRARVLMSEKGLERVIVLAVDSLLDSDSLDWLAGQERLKAPDRPSGLMPGEAGACFLLEPITGAQARGAAVRVRVAPPGQAVEANSFASGKLSQGVGLAAAISAALAAPARRPFNGPVIADCNGEAWRAHEFGSACVRAAERLGPRASHVFPCAALGDTGAASAAIGVCMAVRSLERGYAGDDAVLVVASSEQGHVGAVCVSKA